MLHTHSVWSTILSDLHADEGGLFIEGYEMLKGLDGVHTHDHREWVPIVDNDQNMPRLARVARDWCDSSLLKDCCSRFSELRSASASLRQERRYYFSLCHEAFRVWRK